MLRATFVLVLLALYAALSLAQPQPGQPPPGPPPSGGSPGPGGPGRGFAPPPFPGDSTAAERDSLMNVVMKNIAGKEQMPAESVFKDIQMFKGRPAGDIPRVMNYGFGRSLAVSCFHCHARNDWAKDEKKQKRIAREMMKMVGAVNTDYIAKIEGLGDSTRMAGGPDQRPRVNCSTCHRGSVRTNPEVGRMGGPPRPGSGR
jgi:hypothetical protein